MMTMVYNFIIILAMSKKYVFYLDL